MLCIGPLHKLSNSGQCTIFLNTIQIVVNVNARPDEKRTLFLEERNQTL